MNNLNHADKRYHAMRRRYYRMDPIYGHKTWKKDLPYYEAIKAVDEAKEVFALALQTMVEVENGSLSDAHAGEAFENAKKAMDKVATWFYSKLDREAEEGDRRID